MRAETEKGHRKAKMGQEEYGVTVTVEVTSCRHGLIVTRGNAVETCANGKTPRWKGAHSSFAFRGRNEQNVSITQTQTAAEFEGGSFDCFLPVASVVLISGYSCFFQVVHARGDSCQRWRLDDRYSTCRPQSQT